MENGAFKVHFFSSVARLLNQDVKAGKTCTFPMEVTKEGAQSLVMKMQNAEFTVSCI